ncbi:hypothetical protein BDZ91DRAFT_718802 [Kalaharituber pfeilii]|nr:hypothetical protein BDZ91DRAFT_718802 [Kalaharituber pfeilii]
MPRSSPGLRQYLHHHREREHAGAVVGAVVQEQLVRGEELGGVRSAGRWPVDRLRRKMRGTRFVPYNATDTETAMLTRAVHVMYDALRLEVV